MILPQQERRLANYRDLKVWAQAHELSIAIYKATAAFPKDEQYGLTSQIRRSCTSIPANVAEGYGRGSDAELARYLRIAMGSATELDYHLLLARDINILDISSYDRLVHQLDDVRRMLTAFIQRLTPKS
jgi:four helix bundle protein